MDDWELDAEETNARAAELFSKPPAAAAPPSNDPERLQREAEEERDKVLLAQQLFGSAEKAVDVLEQVPKKLVKTLHVVPQSSQAEAVLSFNTVADCQKAVEYLTPKITNSQGKSVAMLELLMGLLKVCAPKMTEKDLMTISNKAKDMKQQLQMENRLSLQSAKKIYSGGKDQIKNYQGEMDMMYGAASDDDEDDDDIDDDFM